jgi:hypothetical protein
MTDMSKFKVATAFKHLDPNQGLADGIAAGFSTIRYRGKMWSLNHAGKNYPFKRLDDGSPLTYIDIIILGISAGLSKTYFGPDEWTEESSNAPICASLKGDVPDPGVPEPQSRSCGICSHNEFITKPNGSKGKECQDHKRMAVLLLPTMTKKMLGSALLEPVFLKIPPGSLKSLKKFSDELQHQGIPFAAVVTRVSFSSDRIFEMSFEVVQALTDAEAPLVFEKMDTPLTKAIMGSMPQLAAPAPPPPVARVDTGLISAFANEDEDEAPSAKPAAAAPAQPRRPGRPKAQPQAAKVIDNEPETPPADKKKAMAAFADDVEADGPWDESDTDLDATVAKLMGDKMQKMLK